MKCKYIKLLFTKEDLDRAIIRWWQYPFLWLLPTYCQITEGYVFKYKVWNGAYYLIKYEPVDEGIEGIKKGNL